MVVVARSNRCRAAVERQLNRSRLVVVTTGCLYAVAGDTEPTDTAAPRARLCVLHSGHDGSVYGFTLRNDDSGSDGGRPGQFVDSVDLDSPAAAAGLRSGDRIVEVNGVNVDQLSRDEVMERINCDDGDAKDAVRLLVLDRDADDYFRAKDITVTSDMEHCVERITGPETKPEGLVTLSIQPSCFIRHDSTVVKFLTHDCQSIN